MKTTEHENVKFATEKREKVKKVGSLNEEISKLGKEIEVLRVRITSTNTHMSQVSQQIADVDGKIVAAGARIGELQNTIKNKQDHINALIAKINHEKAKTK